MKNITKAFDFDDRDWTDLRAEGLERREAEREYFARRGKNTPLESALAVQIHSSIVERGLALKDYRDWIRDILQENGVRRISTESGEVSLGRAGLPAIYNYTVQLFDRECLPIKPVYAR